MKRGIVRTVLSGIGWLFLLVALLLLVDLLWGSVSSRQGLDTLSIPLLAGAALFLWLGRTHSVGAAARINSTVSASTFFRACLALPLVLPALLWAFVTLGENAGIPVPGVIGGLALFLLIAARMAGIPYVLLCILLLWWLRHRSATFIHQVWLFLPPVFFGVMVPVDLGINVLGHQFEARSWLDGIPSLAIEVILTPSYSRQQAHKG